MNRSSFGDCGGLYILAERMAKRIAEKESEVKKRDEYDKSIEDIKDIIRMRSEKK